jgi:signal transduction histidine kinase
MSVDAAVLRPARWPWVLLSAAIGWALVGMVLVALNDHSLASNATNFMAFMGMGVVGALISSRDRTNRIGLLLLWVSVTTAIAFTTWEASTYLADRTSTSSLGWLAWPGNTLWVVAIFPLLILLPVIFPDGHLPSPRWRFHVWAGTALCALAVAAIGFAARSFELSDAPGGPVRVRNPLHVSWLEPITVVEDVGWFAVLGLFFVAAASMVMRFRRSRGVERQQLKWFAFSALILVVYFVATAVLETLGVDPGFVSDLLSGLAFLGIPVAVGIAILQFRLWDLDVVVRKAVVAGMLVVLAVLVYAGAVALVGRVAVDRESPAMLFAIALGLGVAFRPVMRVARHLSDRIVYGRRATPYEVLTEFSERVGTSYATEDVLPRMAQVLAEGTGAEITRIWLSVGSGFRPEASWPRDAPGASAIRSVDEMLNLPGETVTEVRDKGELLGALSVRMPASDPMSPSKEKLVRDLAAQAGLLLRNVRLVEDLRASRQRLVAAQDEERRRLERNIHDGAQQQLVSLAVKARLARQLTERDPEKAAELLAQIESETQVTLEDLRDLARGIYPPLLADRGLVAALEAQSRKTPMAVSVEADGVGRYPVEIEATVYFCALEALQNVTKYADADRATVRLSQANGNLSFAVIDHGRGFDPSSVPSGSGLQGMADRLAAVGGSLDVGSAPGRGTTIAGTVPVAVG